MDINPSYRTNNGTKISEYSEFHAHIITSNLSHEWAGTKFQNSPLAVCEKVLQIIDLQQTRFSVANCITL